MRRRAIKNIVALVGILFLAYHSVYFKKLDEVKTASTEKVDSKKYSEKFWKEKLTPGLNKAIGLNSLVRLLKIKPEETFNKYSHALGIGNIRFFLVKSEGEIKSVNENDVSVIVRSDTAQIDAKIITEYVFGNAVRDASGLIDINQFTNMTDFNTISEELNNIIRSQVLPPFKINAKAGAKVEFKGAIELNREHLNLENIEITPIEIKVVQ